MEEEYDHLLKQEYLDDKDLLDELIWHYRLLQDRLSPILWGSLSEQHQVDSSMNVEEVKKIIEDTYTELQQHAGVKGESR